MVEIKTQGMGLVSISVRVPIYKHGHFKCHESYKFGTYYMTKGLGNPRYFTSLSLLGHTGDYYTYRAIELTWDRLPRELQCVFPGFISLVKNKPEYVNRWI
jgi:hypothetical protein